MTEEQMVALVNYSANPVAKLKKLAERFNPEDKKLADKIIDHVTTSRKPNVGYGKESY